MYYLIVLTVPLKILNPTRTIKFYIYNVLDTLQLLLISSQFLKAVTTHSKP